MSHVHMPHLGIIPRLWDRYVTRRVVEAREAGRQIGLAQGIAIGIKIGRGEKA